MTIEIHGPKQALRVLEQYDGTRVIDTEKSRRIGGAKVVLQSLGGYRVFAEDGRSVKLNRYDEAESLCETIALLDALKFSRKTGREIIDLRK